jgi:hypothetical protein
MTTLLMNHLFLFLSLILGIQTSLFYLENELPCPQVSRRHFKADDKSREIIHSPTEQDQNVNSVDFFNSAVNGMLFNDKLEFKSCDNAGENDQRNNYCVTNQNQRIYENLQFRNNPLTNSNIVNGFTGTENNISSLEIEQSMSSSRLSGFS